LSLFVSFTLARGFSPGYGSLPLGHHGRWLPSLSGANHDAVTPTLPPRPATAQLQPADPGDLPLARRPLRPPLPPLARAARRRGRPPLPAPPAAAAARLLERLQPGRLRPALPVPRHPARPLPHRHDPLRQEAQDLTGRAQPRGGGPTVRPGATAPGTPDAADHLRLRPARLRGGRLARDRHRQQPDALVGAARQG